MSLGIGGNRSTIIIVAVIAILFATGWETAEYRKELFLDDLSKIYESEYDVQNLSTPSPSRWWQLYVMERLFKSTPLGSYLLRKLFLKNGGHKVVEFAHAIQQSDPMNSRTGLISGKEFGMGEPLIRLSPKEYEWHTAAALESADRIHDLMSSSSDYDDQQQGQPSKRRKYRSIRDYHNAYIQKSSTPTKVFDKLIQFYKDTDARLRIMQEVDYDVAKQAAKESTQRYENGNPISIWDGVPVVIKPEIDVKGLHTTNGRQMVDSQIAKYDDIIVSRLRKAGAIIIGQTVMHEMGIQPTGYNTWYGGPVNPYDMSRFSGGSSSGSAVAVATGMVPVAIGFDGGGSVRIPAAWSGIVGLAVGYTRIPYSKSSVNVNAATKAGPLVNNIEDAAEALLLVGQPISEEEGRDSHPYHLMYGGDGPPPPHLKPRWAVSNDGDKITDDEKPVVRIGVFKDWVSHRPSQNIASVTIKDDAVYKVFEKTLSSLTSSLNDRQSPVRFEVVDFTIPRLQLQAMAHSILLTSMFTFIALNEEFRGSSARSKPNVRLEKATQVQVKLGTVFTSLELLACERIRAFATAQWRKVLMEKADVILTPMMQMTSVQRPPGSDVAGFSDLALIVEMLRYVWPGNLAGLPGLAVPTGVDSAGLPISMQVICAHWHEADCLAVGREIEKIYESERSIPPAEVFVDLLS
mmetsp:Transcript_7817/g.11229  ORF Transcript_7817/g.11229 Transcript_7817/m.11229 type:complete len:688 (+) Transcript_7817:92-2155(+)